MESRACHRLQRDHLRRQCSRLFHFEVGIQEFGASSLGVGAADTPGGLSYSMLSVD